MNVIMSFELRYTCTPPYVCPSFCAIRYFEQTPVDTRAPVLHWGEPVKLRVYYIYTSNHAHVNAMSMTSIGQIIFHSFIFVVKSENDHDAAGNDKPTRVRTEF